MHGRPCGQLSTKERTLNALTASTARRSTSPSTADHDGPTSVRQRVIALVAPVILVLLSFVSVMVHVPQNQELSPIDEWVYIDYLAKVPTQGVVTQGEETGTYARSEILCEGVRLVFPPNPESCAAAKNGTAADSAFPMDGTTSADIYTPLYFVSTWAMAQVVQLFGVHDLTDAASYTGAVWLALGMLFLFAALRRMGVGRVVGVALGALVIASPSAYWSSTYVSTDAPALAAGAAVLWLAIRIMQGRSGRIAFLVVGVLVVLLKVQNLVGVALAALALVGWALQQAWNARGDSPSRLGWLGRGVLSRTTITAVGTVVASVVAQGVWVLVRAHIATGPSPDQGTGQPLSIKAMITESTKFLAGTDVDPTGKGTDTIALVLAGTIVSWLSVAGVLGLVAMGRRGSAEVWIARSSLVMALVAGPLLVLGVGVVSGYYFTLPARYGIVMLPAFLVSAGVLLQRRRWVGYVLAVVAGVVYVAALSGR